MDKTTMTMNNQEDDSKILELAKGPKLERITALECSSLKKLLGIRQPSEKTFMYEKLLKIESQMGLNMDDFVNGLRGMKKLRSALKIEIDFTLFAAFKAEAGFEESLHQVSKYLGQLHGVECLVINLSNNFKKSCDILSQLSQIDALQYLCVLHPVAVNYIWVPQDVAVFNLLKHSYDSQEDLKKQSIICSEEEEKAMLNNGQLENVQQQQQSSSGPASKQLSLNLKIIQETLTESNQFGVNLKSILQIPGESKDLRSLTLRFPFVKYYFYTETLAAGMNSLGQSKSLKELTIDTNSIKLDVTTFEQLGVALAKIPTLSSIYFLLRHREYLNKQEENEEGLLGFVSQLKHSTSLQTVKIKTGGKFQPHFRNFPLVVSLLSSMPSIKHLEFQVGSFLTLKQEFNQTTQQLQSTAFSSLRENHAASNLQTLKLIFSKESALDGFSFLENHPKMLALQLSFFHEFLEQQDRDPQKKTIYKVLASIPNLNTLSVSMSIEMAQLFKKKIPQLVQFSSNRLFFNNEYQEPHLFH